jgi:hypothetical protein
MQRLRAIAPGDAAGFAAFVAGITQPQLRADLTGMDYATARKGMRNLYNRQLAKIVRQEMPVSPDGVVDEAALSARVVEYDEGADAQQRTKVNINGGQLIRNDPPNNTGQPVDTRGSVTQHSGPGWEIFVVSPTGDIHMDSHKIGKYHHSSLLGGGAVSMGGEMLVVGGTIQVMSNKSGHYLPSKVHFRQFLHRLKKQGVPLTFQIAAGFGVPASTAAALEAGGGRETYHAEKLKVVLESLKRQHGDQAVADALRDQEWHEQPDGSIQDSSGGPVADKLVLQGLKQALGKAKSKVTETGKAALSWV